MVVLGTCKNEEDPIKSEGARVVTLYINFFRHSRVANSVVSGGMWQKLELIQALMVVLVACKNYEDPLKIKVQERSHFSHCKSMGIFIDV